MLAGLDRVVRSASLERLLDSGGGETMPSKALHFEWVRGFNSNRILSKINKIRKIDGQRCSFEAGDYAFWLPVLNSAIRADRTAERLKTKCISSALSDAAITLSNADLFLPRCEQEFEKCRSQNSYSTPLSPTLDRN